MSNFKCNECGRNIVDTDFGFITGCEHYPIEISIWEICKKCKYNWDGHCIKGNDAARSNPKSIIHIIGCEEFEFEIDKDFWRDKIKKLKEIAEDDPSMISFTIKNWQVAEYAGIKNLAWAMAEEGATDEEEWELLKMLENFLDN